MATTPFIDDNYEIIERAYSTRSIASYQVGTIIGTDSYSKGLTILDNDSIHGFIESDYVGLVVSKSNIPITQILNEEQYFEQMSNTLDVALVGVAEIEISVGGTIPDHIPTSGHLRITLTTGTFYQEFTNRSSNTFTIPPTDYNALGDAPIGSAVKFMKQYESYWIKGRLKPTIVDVNNRASTTIPITLEREWKFEFAPSTEFEFSRDYIIDSSNVDVTQEISIQYIDNGVNIPGYYVFMSFNWNNVPVSRIQIELTVAGVELLPTEDKIGGSHISENCSFNLVRTNPKLSTNVKILTDGSDSIYLESIDANPALSKYEYKAFKTAPDNKYSYDLRRFYNNGKLPVDLAFEFGKSKDSLSIAANYSEQYNMLYSSGCYVKNSKLYDEELAMFAPLWIEPSCMPDYFIIFRIDDPVSINAVDIEDEYDELQDLAIKDPEKFIDNYLRKAKIIKTFDITERTNIGTYIRNHANDSSFPESPISIGFGEDDISTWNGISITKGGFVKLGNRISADSTHVDKTIIEQDAFITSGFQRHAVAVANLLNMEFLFNDDATKYSVNRYFGLYVDEIALGSFVLDGDALYSDRINEPVQTPYQTSPTIGYAENTGSTMVYNPNGVKLYVDDVIGDIIRPYHIYDSARIAYIKDKFGNFHNIKNAEDWEENTQVRLFTKNVDIGNFTGFTGPISHIKSTTSSENGISHIIFEVTGNLSNGSQILIGPNDPYGDAAERTVIASNTIPAGNNSTSIFSTLGEFSDISKAIAKAFRYLEDYNDERPWSTMSWGSKVVIYADIASESWNGLNVSYYTTSGEIDLLFENAVFENAIGHIVYPGTAAVGGSISYSQLNGGSNTPANRIYIDAASDEIITTKSYIKTEGGYSKVEFISEYLDSPKYDGNNNIYEFSNIGDIKVLQTIGGTVSLNSSKKASVYELFRPDCGILSIYPINDFDFDFYSTDYASQSDARHDLYKEYMYDTASYGAGSSAAIGRIQNTIIDLLGSGSVFVNAGGYADLYGPIREGKNSIDSVNSEYDRLSENELSDLAITSRANPWINKWVYEDFGRNARENEYRLNTSESFGFSNFSPSFKEFSSNAKFFTHEWPYIGTFHPPYMTDADKLVSYSYCGAEFDITELLGATTDYFTEYLTSANVSDVSVPKRSRYSIIGGGNDYAFAESFFRGVQVIVKERTETSDINHNTESLTYRTGGRFNGYKFSSIIAFDDDDRFNIKIIENKKYQNIIVVIGVGLRDDIFCKDIDNNRYYLDRTALYTLQHQLDPITGLLADITISGSITLFGSTWHDGAVYTVTGQQNSTNGSYPNFKRDMKLTADGVFQDLYVDIGGQVIIFSDIISVDSNSFRCITARTASLIPLPTSSAFGWPSNSQLSLESPVYVNGGYNAYEGLVDDISFANIADMINSGHTDVRYITIDENFNQTANEFVLEFIDPEMFMKTTYITVEDDPDKPINLATFSKIGSKLTPMSSIMLSPMSRYNGNYMPRFKNVITFKDDDVTISEGFNNLNTTINLEDDVFGIIENYHYNKTNPDNQSTILELNTKTGYNSIYPAIDEIAIARKDYFIFRSTWDHGFYNKYVSKNDSIPIRGTRSLDEQKAFMGSALMSLPDNILIESFDTINIENIKSIDRIDSIDADVVVFRTANKQFNYVELEVFVDKALKKYLINDGISTTFINYINTKFGYGLEDSIDDDIARYVDQNIVSRYEIDQLYFYEKKFNNNTENVELIQLDISDAEKASKGYSIVKNLQIVPAIEGSRSINFRVIYNIEYGISSSIAMSISLKKK